jgi:hypothetical protein
MLGARWYIDVRQRPRLRGGHCVLMGSRLATGKLNGVEPLAWLTDVLQCMAQGRTTSS